MPPEGDGEFPQQTIGSLHSKSQRELDNASSICRIGNFPKGILRSDTVVHGAELGLVQEVDKFSAKLKLRFAPPRLRKIELFFQSKIPIVRAIVPERIKAKVPASSRRDVRVEIITPKESRVGGLNRPAGISA